MILKSLYNRFLNSKGVSTDTRVLKPDSLFFALRGPHFNGNDFAKKALDMGANGVVVDDPDLVKLGPKIIVVENSLQTLQNLARHHRKKLNIPVIALTGSNGKTTTKELIRSVLSRKYNVGATEGNLNNTIGVPLTLLKLNRKHELAIIEMGANHSKEIQFLSDIALPNWGYITNFGKAHLEGFGSLEGVIQAKSELYQHLIQNHQNILVNANDPIQIRQTKGYPTTTFGSDKSNDFQIQYDKHTENGLKLYFQNSIIQNPLYGGYNLPNIAAALAFGAIYNIPISASQKAIASYQSSNNRSQKIKIKNSTLILDAYNANPTSMQAALNSFSKKASSKSALILGDMMELGTVASEEHEALLDLCLQTKIGFIFTIGSQFKSTKRKDPRIEKFDNCQAFRTQMKNKKIDFDILLIKGSRSMQLEDLIPFFKTQIQ
ncbi:MAG: UDP-N-acetylmuramoyl-tripeptide--D-alanyl-D-alanine ligase [Flavobacteriaceae bacterium]